MKNLRRSKSEIVIETKIHLLKKYIDIENHPATFVKKFPACMRIALNILPAGSLAQRHCARQDKTWLQHALNKSISANNTSEVHYTTLLSNQKSTIDLLISSSIYHRCSCFGYGGKSPSYWTLPPNHRNMKNACCRYVILKEFAFVSKVGSLTG